MLVSPHTLWLIRRHREPRRECQGSRIALPGRMERVPDNDRSCTGRLPKWTGHRKSGHALNPHPLRKAETRASAVPTLRGRLRAGDPLSGALIVWAPPAIKHRHRPHSLHGSFRLRHSVAARARVFGQPRRLGSRFVPFASDLSGTVGPAPCASVRSRNHDSSHLESSCSESLLRSCARQHELR